MSNRTPPYRHLDGSNCWTKNCSKGSHLAANVSASLKGFRNSVEPKSLAEEVKSSDSTKANLSDIAPLEDFEKEVRNGYVRVQRHPTLPYEIYDYDNKAQFERHWNPVTLASRGLIIDKESKEVLGRCLGKFFNYNEPEINPADLEGKIVVTEKLDGSCGISYPTPDGLAIATRGSFASDQALHATSIYREKYHGKWKPKDSRTYIFEIIYPENQIVVNYGGMDDIVLLSAVDKKTGKSIPASAVKEWKGTKVEEFPYNSMAEVLESPSRQNREGFVVHYAESDIRVKYKYEEYVSLHRVVTNVNSRRIWEIMSGGGNIKGWSADLPDEFRNYIDVTSARLNREFEQKKEEVKNAHESLISKLPKDYTRKDYAMEAKKDKNLFNMMMSYSDGHEQKLSNSIWDRIKPDFEKMSSRFDKLNEN